MNDLIEEWYNDTLKGMFTVFLQGLILERAQSPAQDNALERLKCGLRLARDAKEQLLKAFPP